MKQNKIKNGVSFQDKPKNKTLINSDSEQCETEEGSTKEIILYKNLLKEISDTLTSIIQNNKKNKHARNDNSPFVHEHAPKLSIFDYLLRIQKYSNIENSTFIIALIYIDRICQKKGIILTKYNIHRILFTSILIAIKYNEDIIYDNLFYSKVAGVTTKELLVLENSFLDIIDFDLYVSNDIYKKYSEYLDYK
jgi:hypothetical protein